MAGIWASVILGVLIVLPVFYLGKAIFNEKVGIVSALLATVHPFLYKYSGSVLTESTFYFLLAASALFGWKAFDQGRVRDSLLFGLFTSLSYLTRPEGIGFLFIFGMWVLWIHPVHERRRWMKRIGILFFAFFAFLIFSSPYFLQLRKETGNWQISRKVSVSIGSFSEEDEGPSIEAIKVKKKVTLFALLHSFFWVSRRYTSHFLPLSLPWVVFGFSEVIRWVAERVKKEGAKRWLSPALVLVLLTVLCIQGRILHAREHRVIQREVGLWVRNYRPGGGRLMSRLPQEAFYADLQWIRIPRGTYDEIIRTARSNGVRYIAIDEKIEEDSPGFLNKIKGEDLIMLKEWKKRDRSKAVCLRSGKMAGRRRP